MNKIQQLVAARQIPRRDAISHFKISPTLPGISSQCRCNRNSPVALVLSLSLSCSNSLVLQKALNKNWPLFANLVEEPSTSWEPTRKMKARKEQRCATGTASSTAAGHSLSLPTCCVNYAQADWQTLPIRHCCCVSVSQAASAKENTSSRTSCCSCANFLCPRSTMDINGGRRKCVSDETGIVMQ